MTCHKHALLFAFLFILACLPAAGDEAEQEKTIMGTWYTQVMEGQAIPTNDVFSITFNEGGKASSFMREGDYERKESWKYEHDKEKATLTLYELDDEGTPDEEPEVVVSYRFVDEMLVFTLIDPDAEQADKGDDADEEEAQTMELTRNKEGTKRHQKMRKEQAEEEADDAFDAAEEAAADVVDSVRE